MVGGKAIFFPPAKQHYYSVRTWFVMPFTLSHFGKTATLAWITIHGACGKVIHQVQEISSSLEKKSSLFYLLIFPSQHSPCFAVRICHGTSVVDFIEKLEFYYSIQISCPIKPFILFYYSHSKIGPIICNLKKNSDGLYLLSVCQNWKEIIVSFFLSFFSFFFSFFKVSIKVVI